ncbi:GntR family transcriptional regulator [Rhodococcus sp. RD6.2]|nr:GntR family transcriptional regulator [Rhodococcus sp. RD6.2]
MFVLIRIDPASPTPLFEQVAASVRRALADGSVGPGDRLPGARELAESLDLNVHTVLRGYQQLRDEGLIELRRGRGAVVADDAGGRSRLQEAVLDVVTEARRLGLSAAELVTLIKKEMT